MAPDQTQTIDAKHLAISARTVVIEGAGETGSASQGTFGLLLEIVAEWRGGLLAAAVAFIVAWMATAPGRTQSSIEFVVRPPSDPSADVQTPADFAKAIDAMTVSIPEGNADYVITAKAERTSGLLVLSAASPRALSSQQAATAADQIVQAINASMASSFRRNAERIEQSLKSIDLSIGEAREQIAARDGADEYSNTVALLVEQVADLRTQRDALSLRLQTCCGVETIGEPRVRTARMTSVANLGAPAAAALAFVGAAAFLRGLRRARLRLAAAPHSVPSR